MSQTLPALAPELLVLAAAGGAFGASIGALQAFSLAGLVIILGELAKLVTTSTGTALPVDLTATVGFGVVLGPHVAFGGGAAALAYAARAEYLSDAGPTPAKAITRGLGNRPDVLAVGGLFGIIGHGIATGSEWLALPVDPIALGVVGSALLHRVAFGYGLLGDDGTPVADWLPYQHRVIDVSMLGLVMGLLGAYIAYVTASPFLAFGVSVVALALLCANVPKIPVTHHMTLPASTVVCSLAGTDATTPAALATAVPVWQALLAGAVFGVVGAVAGEGLQRVAYAPGATHLDPPAASIVVTTGCIAVLAWTGVLPSAAWIPLP